MLNKLVKTNEDYALTIARLVLGVLFFIHGDQLMLGWFGGYGLTGSLEFFTQHLGIPTPFAFLAICAEFFGGLMLIVGLLGRVAALAIICTLAVAVAKVHWHFGLFMNWFGHRKAKGSNITCWLSPLESSSRYEARALFHSTDCWPDCAEPCRWRWTAWPLLAPDIPIFITRLQAGNPSA